MSFPDLLILAGGKGTRLRDKLEHGLPKPLVNICGRPLLDYQLCLARSSGIQNVHLMLGYGASYIYDYCGDGSKWGVKVIYHEENEPLGTAGAVLNVLNELPNQFIVMYGDTMLDVDLVSFYQLHESKCADITVFLHPNDHPHDSDLVEVDASNNIVAFHSYPHSKDGYFQNLANASLYVINKSVLNTIRFEGGMLDFCKQVFPSLVDNGHKLYGYNGIEYIKDIGTPERLLAVEQDLNSGKFFKRNLKSAKKAIFLDRDGTINDQTDYVVEIQQMRLLPGVSSAIRAINKSDFLTVVITNQPVIARGDVDENKLRKIHNKMEWLLGQEGAFIDRIYFCPHHPDSGFAGERREYKKTCFCRKPNIGLIEQAIQELNIDLSQSWFIGDSTVDIETAKRAGVKSILLSTGYAGKDNKFVCNADYNFIDLQEAVNFILER
ncbi:MAG: HAD-IIIA family hydrolase [Gammaproteobacteria bacterium]